MKNRFKSCLIFALVAMGSLSAWAADSESGHWLYFKNTNKAWTNVYLRIGRSDNVYTKPFTRIGASDWWKCETPDYKNYTHFTITNSSDDTAPVTTYENGIYRLYEWSYNLKEDRWFVLTDGPNASGNHYYWNNASSTSYPEATISSETGHRIWFDNSNSKWSNVYLRIGRSVVLGIGAYTSTWPMTRFGSTDFWYVDTENWSNAQVWTITDTNTNNGDSKSPYDLPSGANRLYYYNDNIEGTVVYVAGETTPSGTDASGVYYWGNYTHTTIPPAINGCSNCFMVY